VDLGSGSVDLGFRVERPKAVKHRIPPMSAAMKKRKVGVYQPEVRNYMEVRFMAGDSLTDIARQNPWGYNDVASIEEILREQWLPPAKRKRAKA
jgi:hypothetical protein